MSYVVVGAGPAGVIAAETLSRAWVMAATSPWFRASPKHPIRAWRSPTSWPRISRKTAPTCAMAKAITTTSASRSCTNGLPALIQRASPLPSKAAARWLTEKLLLATGATPVRPPIPGMDLDGVKSCWTLEDARQIIANSKPGDNVVLMGAGFIGCIILEALVARKVNLTVIEMADRMVARMMDKTGGDIIADWCENQGVKVMISTRVNGVSENGDGTYKLELEGKDPINADLVVCATGVKSNMEFLEGSGIETDMGVLINEHMETNVA